MGHGAEVLVSPPLEVSESTGGMLVSDFVKVAFSIGSYNSYGVRVAKMRRGKGTSGNINSTVLVVFAGRRLI